MPSVAFDRFYRYAELTDDPQAFAAEHPQLGAIESIGKSHEGRDIWVLTVTNLATGPATEKPAFWVDGNIHATEVAASVASVYFLNTWSRNTARMPTSRARSTRARSTSARASIPTAPNGRSPTSRDGCARARVRIRTTRTRSKGSTVEDIDGDGRILQMRIPRPQRPVEGASGGAAADGAPRSDRDRRDVLPDPSRRHARGLGRLHVKRSKNARQGLDLNRNFPANWRQEFEQLGAGPFPTSEPEVRALVAVHRPPSEHHRRRQLPHLERRAAAPVRSLCPTTR